ncbi:MAG: hypothetical protein KIS67_10895 [Verrucomicrobiae bacterium]|nr:hypothetical protein [Verrucomicrobiae bacterium]
MNSKIDFKSALGGLAVGVLAMLAIGATDGSSNRTGRFQTAGGAGFFITTDTVTGQSWFANVSAANMTHVDKGFFDKKPME